LFALCVSTAHPCLGFLGVLGGVFPVTLIRSMRR
jgi:hypothetical protein